MRTKRVICVNKGAICLNKGFNALCKSYMRKLGPKYFLEELYA